MSKVALITGANKGIGFETARQLGQQGVTILAAGRSQERIDAAVASLKSEGFEAEGVIIDMENADTFGPAVDHVTEKYGKLDILVNNAGIMIEGGGEWMLNNAEDVSQQDLQRTFQVNVFGLIDLTQRLLPLLKKSEAGRIVNLSSILGSLTLHADPESPIYGTKVFAYNASKAALNMYTIHLASALKDTNIKVNSAHPGWVQTDMGGEAAPTEVNEGAKTGVDYALAGADGPNGEYGHLGDALPW